MNTDSCSNCEQIDTIPTHGTNPSNHLVVFLEIIQLLGYYFLWCLVGNEGMIHFIVNDNPINPNSHLHSLLLKRTSKLFPNNMNYIGFNIIGFKLYHGFPNTTNNIFHSFSHGFPTSLCPHLQVVIQMLSRTAVGMRLFRPSVGKSLGWPWPGRGTKVVLGRCGGCGFETR